MIAPSHRFVSDPSNQEAISVNSKALRLAALVDLDEQSAGIKKQVQYVSKLDSIDEAPASLPDRRYIRDRLKSGTGLHHKEVTLGIVDKMHDILAYSFIKSIAPCSEIQLAT